jgi:[ribosomal protein S5]-alanine N-acetyltransferase
MTFTRSTAPLAGQRVTLRQWQPEEAEWYVSARDEEIFRFTTEHRGLTADVARANIAACLTDPSCIGYAIVETATGELAGNIAMSPLDLEDERAEVMYWLAPSARRRGLVTDAVRTLVAWAFDALPIAEVELLTDPENEPSQRVAERCGFASVGMVDGRMLFRRHRSD